MNSLQEIAAAILNSKKILITSHVMPDGDSVGSLVALALSLADAGLKVSAYLADEVPDRFGFLAETVNIVSGKMPGNDFDLTVILDCSDPRRVGSLWEKVKERKVVNIDHHPTNTEFGLFNYVDIQAAATGEIIFDLIRLIGVPISKKIAAALYVAISTDTGSFRFENTSQKTHKIAADLLSAGVSPREITPVIFDTKPLSFYCLLKVALNSLGFLSGGKIAHMTLTHKDIESCQAKDDDLDGLVNYAKNVEGVEVGLLFREKNDGSVKVGFRSASVDVGAIAKSLDGGGHARAAGCVMAMDLKQAFDAVIYAVSREIAR